MSLTPPPISLGSHQRVVILSDTHSRPHASLHLRLDELAPTLVLHAGDIGDHGVLDALEAHAPVWAVRGNIDNRRLPDVRLLDLEAPNGRLRIYLTHIALRGPRLRRNVVAAARESSAGLVICGHSHVPFIGRDQGLSVFNPGSVGPRRFSLPIVFGVMDLDSTGVHMRHVSVETGENWQP